MNANNLYQLAYLSSATNEPSQDELSKILNVSVANNNVNQITGFLMYVENSFFQVIEGPKVAIDELFITLQRDPRHCRVTQLLNSPINSRRFADWSMAFMHYEKLDDVPVLGYSRYLQDFLSFGENNLNFVENHNKHSLEYISLEHMISNMRKNLLGV